MNFSLATTIAVGMLSVPPETLPVTDTVYTAIDGIDRQSEFGNRTMVAVVDASGSRRLEQAFGGMVSDGDIGIYTGDVLHFLDADGNEDRKQSFVRWCGIQYRVIAVDDWTAKGGKRLYLATRHISQDQV